MKLISLPFQTSQIVNFKNVVLTIIFALFIFSSTTHLSSIPGLLGDEGDEGQNISELLSSKKPPLVGERSYIGAWIDYIRVPFVSIFGHNALALRLVTLIFSIACFWITYKILTRLFGDISGLIGLTAVTFSPIYFAEQRIAWAITLLPFFAVLTIYSYQQKSKWSPLLTGVVAGLGANTHILFLAVIAGLTASVFPLAILRLIKNFSLAYFKKLITAFVMLAIGFWASFGVQYANLVLYKEDQGNIQKNARYFTDRLNDIPKLAPAFLSGSYYVAHYTSHLLSDNFNTFVICTIATLIFAGLIFSRRRLAYTLWIIATAIYLLTLLYMIEYYALRYFTVTVLSVWLLSGVGLGSIFDRFNLRKTGYFSAIFLCLILVGFNYQNIVTTFAKTGGSTDNFLILGEKYENAYDLVDIRPLVSCIENRSNVFSNNVHIRNRLFFLENSHKFKVATEKYDVEWMIKYRVPEHKSEPREACPSLRHFIVVPITDHMRQVDWPKD